VIEVIPGALMIIVHVEGPAAKWNRQAELVLFIPFAAQWNEAEAL